MGLYRTVLADGQREDLTGFLNRDLLIEQWPVLRRLISRPIRHRGKLLSPNCLLPGLRPLCAPDRPHCRLLAEVLAFGAPSPW
jgi:hypothetical protein